MSHPNIDEEKISTFALPAYMNGDWKSKEARVQTEGPERPCAYVEKSATYNIWYHKTSTNRFSRDVQIREKAATKVDVANDCGTTAANSAADSRPFCIHFARGCCQNGAKCQYHHHIPTKKDSDALDIMKDVFGRTRHMEHKADMGGVGSAKNECTGLCISDLRCNKLESDYVSRTEQTVKEVFGAFGPVVSVKYIAARNLALVRFGYRAAAEFAKVAMSGQPLCQSEAVDVRWAYETPSSEAQSFPVHAGGPLRNAGALKRPDHTERPERTERAERDVGDSQSLLKRLRR